MSRMLTFLAAILSGIACADASSGSASPSRTIFFAGDSTLHSRKYLLEKKYPEEENCLGSWCDELEKSLRPGFRIDNHAYSGCSTKSFIDSGRWARMICRVKPGDFVYIQFGHNDQKKQPDLYAAADGAYRENLIRFRDEVRARGGHTVFGTPMVRRFFHSDGTVADGLEDYPEAVRRLGREIGVPVVDFNAFSRALIERKPQEKSLPWFRGVLNKTDMTHLTKEGAKVMAAAFLENIEGVNCGLSACFQPSGFPIAERGLPPDCAIVVPARTTECMRYAAKELRDYVERLTGVRLAVTTEGTRSATREIRLACTPVPEELGSDGFRLVVSSNRLDVIASPERGILYAVYEILETYGGCRWYASWHAKEPERDRLSVPKGLDVVQKPDFRMRCPFWCDVVYHHDFAARLRVNSHPWGRMEEKYGGDVFRFGGGLASCHTFKKLVPPERYFDSHPEYFSLVKGKRIRKHGQLCLTNPDVLEIVTSNVLECIRKDPTAPVYGVSQNDCLNYCECPSCAAVDAEEESHAGTMIRFVNAIAERIEREFPGKLIETLAYQYTRKPPKKTRPRHNVVPCLCTIECDFLRPIAEGPDPANAAFRKDIEGWSRLTDQLYVWDYATAFRNFPCPFPNVNVLQKNLQFFRGHGVRDIFEQGAHETTLASFPELEAWLMAKWMWNADRPMKPLLDEFFGGFYGKAAPFVRTYFEELHRERLACGTRLGIWERVTSHALSDEFLERADGLFRQALEAVRKEPPVYARNVRGTAFSVAYARFMRTQLQGAPLAWFRKEPPRKDSQANPVVLAQSLQSVMGEVKKVRLAELSRYDEDERALIAKAVAGKTGEIRFPAPSAERAVIEEKDLGFCNDAALGGFVDDPHASNGRAYRAFGNHSKWCNVFFFQRIATDPGQRLQVRVRCRVKRRAGAQGSAICAGLYDDRAARNVCSREIRMAEIPGDGYEWYDVGTIEPRDYHLFWISPGRFDAAKGPAVDELFIDCVELRLVKATARTVDMLPGEAWWGYANYFGPEMPFTVKTDLTIDLRRDNYHNQCAPLLLSDQGRVIWSEGQSVLAVKEGRITVEADSEVVVAKGGATLPEAYRFAMRRWFPAGGKMPDPLLFSAPQLNTWIELTYRQNEKDILAYAKSMRENGVPAGVLMIDDTWQAGYGDWRFEPSRFKDPKSMVNELHDMGYKVMLWMCPYVGMDTPSFRRVAWGINPGDVRGYPARGGFLTERNAKPLPGGIPPVRACRWWNGYGAFLDFSHPNANAWFAEVLDGLVRDYGVDGFKFDGADLSAYDLSNCAVQDAKATNGSLNNGYASYALRYPFCEIRNLWRMQQMPVVVRLHDKPHRWEALRRIVAEMIGAGLLGQPFVCPDMVGGGEWTTFLPGAPFDPDLFVRSAQIHALCPMMQFSASPWRVLDAERQQIVRDIVALRQSFAPMIVDLARRAAADGEPILRNLEYNFPHRGYAGVLDQFMMGDRLLVAPQVEKGAATREVVIPPGKWKADDGTVVTGPALVTVATPLSRIPYFLKQ